MGYLKDFASSIGILILSLLYSKPLKVGVENTPQVSYFFILFDFYFSSFYFYFCITFQPPFGFVLSDMKTKFIFYQLHQLFKFLLMLASISLMSFPVYTRQESSVCR